MSIDTDTRDTIRYEPQAVSEKSTTVAVLLGFFLPPLGYVYVGRPLLGLLNLLTFNYFLLGFLIVPLHVLKTIIDERRGEPGRFPRG
ncbi:MAG: hypothetical protein V5A36_06030 [Natronomonas sp.]